MAVKASASVTVMRVADGVDITGWSRYYQLKTDGTGYPDQPDDNLPIPSGWTDTEPGYTSGSSNTLYFVDQTTFSDGGILYSPVSISSSYEAAKDADSTAISARKRATAKYGYCNDENDETEKTVTCTDFEYFSGAVINVLFTNGIATSGSFSLNVNNKGAKTVLFNGQYVTNITGTNPFRVAANTTVMFVYTHLQENDQGYWLAAPTDSILRGTCLIPINNPTKIVSITNAIIHIGSIAIIKFIYGNSASAPALTISSLGAIPIDTSTPPIWVAGKVMSFTLVYDSGLYWRVNADSFKDNFYHDDQGAHIKSELGNQELLLASDSIQFKEGSNVLARYTANLIELGKNAISSIIKMCKDIFTIKVERTEFEGSYINKGIIEVNLADLDLDEQYVNTSSLIIRNIGEDPEAGYDKSAYIDLRFQPYGSQKTSINMEAEVVSISGTHSIQVNGPVYHGPTQILDAYGYIYDGDGNKISTSYIKRDVVLTNLNVDLESGHYKYEASATGAPTGAGGSLFVFKKSVTYQHQLAFPNNSQGIPHIYHRMRYVNADEASSYTEWKLISMEGHSHTSLNSMSSLFNITYTPSAANVWDRVGTATTSKFTVSEPSLVYIYCGVRRSGLGIHSAGSSATITRTDTYNYVDPDGNIRRSPVFYLNTGSYYVYAKSPTTSEAAVRVYKVNGFS